MSDIPLDIRVLYPTAGEDGSSAPACAHCDAGLGLGVDCSGFGGWVFVLVVQILGVRDLS